MKKYLGSFIFFILLFIIYKATNFGNLKKRLCCEFEEVTLNGVIDKVKMARKNIVSLANEPKDYFFTNKGNYNSDNYKIFYHLAEVGDSIYKAQSADTLWLFKENQIPISFEIISCCE